MTTPCRMSHRLSEVTKKMALARPPPNALRTNSLGVTAESAGVETRPGIGRFGPAVRPKDSVRVHTQEWETKSKLEVRKAERKKKTWGGGWLLTARDKERKGKV